MATYVIGDLQGCARQLTKLLLEVDFTAEDKLWLVGDLVNRGPESAATLEMLMDMQHQCVVVLGNHDLHFLAIYYGGHNPGRSDTMHDLLDSANVDTYARWLVQQNLLHVDASHGCAMVHAGIPHIWSLPEAQRLADEVHQVLRDQHHQVSRDDFFQHMYGNEPDIWSDQLQGLPRLKLITNYFTRMRLVDQQGRLEFSHKGGLDTAPPGWRPWYELAASNWQAYRLLFGHWASLEGSTGFENLIALDTGCVYGRQLTAYCIETNQRFSVAGYNQIV